MYRMGIKEKIIELVSKEQDERRLKLIFRFAMKMTRGETYGNKDG